PFWRREPKEPNPCRPVPSKTPATSRALLPKRGAPSQTHHRSASPRHVRLIQRKLHRSPLHRRRIGAAKTPVKAEDPRGERVTKQERMLTLLSQPAGASIQEMMQATNWQQHSVRGFLAGTV